MARGEYAELVGTALPGSTFVVTEGDDERLAAIVSGRCAGDGTVDPIWAFIAGLNGAGLTIDELFALVDCPMEHGPMLGTVEIELDRPLRAGRPYRVDAVVRDVVRKQGRSGAFDLLRVGADVRDAGGVAATCTTTYVVPRRDGA